MRSTLINVAPCNDTPKDPNRAKSSPAYLVVPHSMGCETPPLAQVSVGDVEVYVPGSTLWRYANVDRYEDMDWVAPGSTQMHCGRGEVSENVVVPSRTLTR